MAPYWTVRTGERARRSSCYEWSAQTSSAASRWLATLRFYFAMHLTGAAASTFEKILCIPGSLTSHSWGRTCR